MPEIYRLFGIRIKMSFGDHSLSHSYAEYEEY
jgi:hypothetical protein